MARLSIDDSIGRDSRLDHLAILCGWSKRETMGCLQLDIWPLCYDRVTPNLPTIDIEIAANRTAITPVKHQGGFVGALIESKMGRPATRADRSFEWRPKGWKEGDPVILIEWPDQEFRDRVYITGAAERIAYIAKARMAGAIGGRKSATSRGNQTKQPSKGRSSDPTSDPSRVPQGVVNPIATASPTAPDSAVAVVPDLKVRADARPHKVPPPEAVRSAKKLLDRILVNNPGSTLAKSSEEKRQSTVLRWADAMRLLHEVDGHGWDDIDKQIDWCQSDQFWKSNILSGDKLREKWDQLSAKMGSVNGTRDVRVGRVEPRAAGEYPDGDLTHQL